MEDFYAAVEYAKKIEKNALQHLDFSDKIDILSEEKRNYNHADQSQCGEIFKGDQGSKEASGL